MASSRQVTLWASGGLINAVELGVSFGYLLFFLTQVLLVPAGLAGTILFVARIWDVVTDPLMGWLSDRVRHRVPRRQFVLAGAIALAALYPLMFLIPPDLPLAHRAGLFAAAYILANTVSTMFAIPHISLVSLLGPPDCRSRLMGWYLTFVRIGLVMVGIGAPVAFNQTPDLRTAFMTLGVASGLLTALVGILVHRSVRDLAEDPGAHASVNPWASLAGALTCLPLRRLAMLQVVKNAAVGCSASVLAFFITIVLEGPIEIVGVMGTVTGALAALLTPVWVLAAARVDVRHLMSLGLGLVATGLALFLVIGAGWPAANIILPVAGIAVSGGLLLYVLISLANSVGDSAVNYAPTAMIPDASEWRRQVSGRDDTGGSFALFSLTGKLGFAAGGFLSSLLLETFGFVSGETVQSELAELGIRLAAGGLPALLLLACIPIALFYPARQKLLAGAPL